MVHACIGCMHIPSSTLVMLFSLELYLLIPGVQCSGSGSDKPEHSPDVTIATE